jgi:hypothetical protein
LETMNVDSCRCGVMHICMCAYIYIYKYVCVCVCDIYIYVCVCVCVCMYHSSCSYACMHVCMYKCMYIVTLHTPTYIPWHAMPKLDPGWLRTQCNKEICSKIFYALVHTSIHYSKSERHCPHVPCNKYLYSKILCAYIYIYIHTCAYKYTYRYMFICAFTHTHIPGKAVAKTGCTCLPSFSDRYEDMAESPPSETSTLKSRTMRSRLHVHVHVYLYVRLLACMSMW